MCILFWKTSSKSHCFCLKPTTQCNFTERILFSIVCLNVYNAPKNFVWKPLRLLEAHLSVYFHRANILFNCMFECFLMFWITSSGNHCFCLKATTHCTFTERILCSIVCLNMYNVWKTSSESHCFWLKPITHCTFTERILRSTVCLNVYIVLKNFFWKPLLLPEAHHSLDFHRAHTLFNCMFECV